MLSRDSSSLYQESCVSIETRHCGPRRQSASILNGVPWLHVTLFESRVGFGMVDCTRLGVSQLGHVVWHPETLHFVWNFILALGR
jgi:hypothetical protein